MKAVLFIVLSTCLFQQVYAQSAGQSPNIIIVTIDGFRWQEIFEGANPGILSNTAYVKDTGLAQILYGGRSAEIRRKSLLPFFWSVIAGKGQLYGNRNFNNKADVKNHYKISYAGYNEIFTGYADPKLIPNRPKLNTNLNLPAYLNTQLAYKGNCAVFSSWNIFPYILREKTDSLLVNSGYENFQAVDAPFETINQVQDSIKDKGACRHDALTFLMAKAYMDEYHPKLMVLGFGETDEYAHSSRYDLYLQQVNSIDKMIAELWYKIQTDPFYKNNTTVIITTDHGRGKKNNSWPGHHMFIRGSGQIWLAMLGKGIEPLGEIKTAGHLYQNQIAQTVASLIGIPFHSVHTTGKPIVLPRAMPTLSLPEQTSAIIRVINRRF